ncbi:fibroblast growth factor receptor 3-like [Acropora millepora]|uniref:fibroblast growth factor receptor 3-like n=1 Tax=Acropora millepora TaxID=45264 RepID=UPI001CF498E7|nr:fibroblast growth factor receptor 3-like [Acropora millepora]
MVTNGGKHPASSTALLYVWRKKGGRGLQSVEGEFKVTKIKAAMKLYSSSDPSIKMVGEPEERSAALGYQSLIEEALRLFTSQEVRIGKNCARGLGYRPRPPAEGDQPNLTFISVNQTVNDGDVVWLNCSADGFPAPNIAWTRLFTNRNVHMPLTITGKQDEGFYVCTAENGIGNPATADVFVTVQFYRPFNTYFSTKLTNAASLNEIFYLVCSGEANPGAEYRFYKEDQIVASITPASQNIGLYPMSVADRVNQVVYKCIPFNSFGDGPTKTINVTVHYPAEATGSGENATVDEGSSKTLTCPVVGNPQPNIKWFKGSAKSGTPMQSEQDLTVKDVGESACYSCVASNSLGTPVSILQCLIVVVKSVTRVPSSTVPRKFECNCPDSQITLLAVIIAVLAIIFILLLMVIIWQQRKLKSVGGKPPYEVPEEKKTGFHCSEITMQDVNLTHIQPKISTKQQVTSELAFMSLQGMSPTGEGYITPQSPAPNVEYTPLDMRTRSWEVERNDVKVERIIGKGAFGQVAKGTGKNLPFRSGATIVAIKMVKANAAESDKQDLKSELQLMKTLKPHPHVIKLLGCVTESEPLLVLIEYVPYGDLLGYLRKSRGFNDTYYKHPDIKPRTSLTSQQLMKFAWQIADGMSYLSLRKVIHRDLAARNVLVGERETCKITDFGMARDIQKENIYERKTKGRLPVKWTAYESLLYGQYTTKSDVWSYGVVLYEISTIGGSPYPRMEGTEIANLLQQGYRMPKPEHVNNDLYKIMKNCWHSEPEARPSFSDLTQQLKRMENQHKRLINLHIYDNVLYASLEDLND